MKKYPNIEKLLGIQSIVNKVKYVSYIKSFPLKNGLWRYLDLNSETSELLKEISKARK